MKNHDASISAMIDPEDEAAIGMLGRDPELQFVRLAAAFNDQKRRLAGIRERCNQFGGLPPLATRWEAIKKLSGMEAG